MYLMRRYKSTYVTADTARKSHVDGGSRLPLLEGEEHLGSDEVEQTQAGLWKRGCGLFAEGNDVERHLDGHLAPPPSRLGGAGLCRARELPRELGDFGE